MRNKDEETLVRIIEHINSVLKYSSKYNNLKDFEDDKMCSEACIFNILQIGELSKKDLSEDYKNNIHGVAWNDIYGLRNRIVHGYSGINLKIIWDVIQDDLPQLKEILKNYLE